MTAPQDLPIELTFVGTATTLLRLGPFTLLTDPNFLHAGQRVYLGYGLFSKRRTDPALEIEQLPPLDAVVLSHLHGDHFDRVAKARLPRSVPVVTTLAAERQLRRWGFGAAEGLRWWASTEMRRGGYRLRITSVPAQHGPAVAHYLMPPTMGSVLEFTVPDGRTCTLYITGDTLYRPALRAIADRFDPIDAMLVHLGGTRVLGLLLTMDGHQGARLVELLRPRLTLPIHYDDYTVFRSPLSDFADEVRTLGLTDGVRLWRRGQTLSVPVAEPADAATGRPDPA
jgi:L-ascorbate metabolism protein UlaG (beta-lactamase superfamily)